jgi:catechol 2,3-dioxygenase-like lactoylglutathione lyase family enzyme
MRESVNQILERLLPAVKSWSCQAEAVRMQDTSYPQIMIRCDHINIVVSDMERSVRFYAQVLGLSRGFETRLQGAWIERVTGLAGAHAHCVFMETSDGAAGVRLELLQYFSPQGVAFEANAMPHTVGLRHLAFTVDDLEALVRSLRLAGVALVSEPVEVPFAVGTLGRKKLCYFHDPDGTLLEVAAYEKREDDGEETGK